MSLVVGYAKSNSHLMIVMSLSQVALYYPLPIATIIAEVHPNIGDPRILYQWKTGGSLVSPRSVLVLDQATWALTLQAPAYDMREVFGEQGGNFSWEIGFTLPNDPNDQFILGTGDFPVDAATIG